MIVEREFCVRRYVVDCKKPDSNISEHGPLLRLAVGLTRVVHESRQIPTWSGVYHPAVVERQEVIGFVVRVLLCLKPSPELRIIDQLADVFDNKVAFLDWIARFQSPAFASCVKCVQTRGLPLLESLVFALFFARTSVRMALELEHPVSR